MTRPLCLWISLVMPLQQIPPAAASAGGSTLTIAVVDFTNTSGDKEYDYLSKAIPENLITSLAEKGELRIVERSRLEDALKEMKLQLTDIVDEASAVRLGKAVGANAIIVGSYVAIGRQIRISARLIDVQTATVITGKSATGRVGEDIFRVMDEMASSMRSELLARAEAQTPLEVQRVPVSPPTGARKGNKTWLYLLGGAAVVGAGVALALGGGGDGQPSPTADVTIVVTW